MKTWIIKFVKYCLICILFFLGVYEVILLVKQFIGIESSSLSTEYMIREQRLRQLFYKIESTHILDLQQLYKEGRIAKYQLILPTRTVPESIHILSNNFDDFCDYYINVNDEGKWSLCEKESNITSNYRLSINSDGIVKKVYSSAKNLDSQTSSAKNNDAKN